MKSPAVRICTRGSVLVEFAIILPIFILLILATIEAGWALYIQSTLADAARQGARVAVTQNVGSNVIVSIIDDIVQSANIPAGQVSVTITPLAISLEPRGTPITIDVSMPYNSASILPAPLFFSTVTLQAQVTMSKEY